MKKRIIYAILYFICMFPTFYLTIFGSNELFYDVPPYGYAINRDMPWILLGCHLILVCLLCAMAWWRGKAIRRLWIVLLPIVATVFQLAPWPMTETWLGPIGRIQPSRLLVFFIPMAMHLSAIVLGGWPEIVGLSRRIWERLTSAAGRGSAAMWSSLQKSGRRISRKALLWTGIPCVVVLAGWALFHIKFPDNSPLTDCDVFAASPDDPNRKANGVALEKIDTEQALPACLLATAKFPNSSRLHFQLGRGYEQSNRFDEAAAEYLKAAKADYAPAQSCLGILYKEGHGVAQDNAQALSWFRKAADLGDASAQNHLGIMYEQGLGVKENYAQAFDWYHKAAEQGNAQAQANAGALCLKGGLMFCSAEQAFGLLLKASNQGVAAAQARLGYMYRKGLGTPQDDTQALRWFIKAAEQGDVDSQYSVGLRYAQGIGVAQDDAKAAFWYRKAAEQGNAFAQNNLGILYRQGRGVERDDSQAMRWYRKAAEQGSADAQYNLGLMYEKGYGVEKDDSQAVFWYRKAVENGHAQAKETLRRVYVAQDTAQAAMSTSTGYGDSKPIQIVKAGKLNNCSRPTMEKAIERIFPAPKWTSEKAPEGMKGDSLVFVSGNLQFKGQDTQAELQFIVNQQAGTFDITTLKMNGVAQSREIATAFFASACQ